MYEKIREALEEIVRPVVFAEATLEQVRAECLDRAQHVAELLGLRVYWGGHYIRPGKKPTLVDSYTLSRPDGMPVAEITFYVEFEKRAETVIAAIAGVDLLLIFRHSPPRPSA